MSRTATLYFNGTILTMEDSQPTAEAVLTQGERIVAVGAERDLRAMFDPAGHEHDLKGCTMLPAFIDPHGHFPDPGFIQLFRVDLASPPRGDCADMASALSRLRARANRTPKGEWVMGVLFDNTAIAEGRMPSRAELDAVSRDHPVWVIHASGHNGSANSYALREQEITDATPDPPGGRYGRDPDTGELTGLIEGLAAMGHMGDTDFLIDRGRFWQGFEACRDEYLSRGVTFAQNAWATRDMLDHFASLPAGQDPGIDILLLPIAELEPGLLAGPNALDWPDTPWFALGPRKLFTDGAFQLQTAFLSEPYFKPFNSEAPRGMTYTGREDLFAQVEKLHRLGYQVHCHCNGDAGSENFIDAVEAALKAHPRDDHRHTVIHGQVLREDQMTRMVQLGMTVSFFSAHIHFWGDRHHDTFLGPDRAARISPAATAERLGLRYTIHNDASVTPTNPIHLAHCAVNRKTASGRTLGEGERISVRSALKAQTIEAAWQVFQENERGSILPGKLADFAILDRNPLDDRDRLADCTVVQTVRRGAVAFAKNESDCFFA